MDDLLFYINAFIIELIIYQSDIYCAFLLMIYQSAKMIIYFNTNQQ